MKNIVLIGMMGSGKSTVGRALAKSIGYKFVDSDHLIEVESSETITSIFDTKGEAFFRALEVEMIARLSKGQGQVISTGGGVVLNQKNVENLLKNSLVVYLDGDAKTLFSRLENGNGERPLLNNVDLKDKISALLKVRKDLYLNAATHVVKLDSKSVDVLVGEIMDTCCISQ